MRKEKGIVTKTEFSQVVDDFLADQHWKPSQNRLPLQDLHQQFLAWAAVKGIPFSMIQRHFCALLIDKGFRAAYANIKTSEGWRFRKIVFAKQEVQS